MWSSLQWRHRALRHLNSGNCLSSLVQLTAKKHLKSQCWWPFVKGIDRRPMDSPHKRPVMKKASPCQLHVIACPLLSSFDSRADWLPIDSGLPGNVLEYITSTGHSALKCVDPGPIGPTNDIYVPVNGMTISRSLVLLGHWGSLVMHTYVYKLGTIGSVSGSSQVHRRAISGNNFRVFIDWFPASFLCEIWFKTFLLGKFIWKYHRHVVVYFVQASIC